MKTAFCNKRSSLKGISLARTASLVFLSLLVAGCPAGKQTSDQPPERAADGKIVIRGSNTIGEELAPRLVAEFKKTHPAAEFSLEFKGTAYGMGALMGGQCDMAGASRSPLKEELELARMRNVELNDYTIGSYSVAVIVNGGCPVTSLTKDQVRNIFTGAIQNWKDVGGPDAPIHLYVRDPISGTYLGFKELAMENKPYAPDPNLFTSYEAIAQAVAKDANGIGYSSIELATNAGVKGVSIAGVQPTIASVNKGDYPYSRVLRFYTNKAKEETARDFVQFILSPQGQQVLVQSGFVPHP
jgi:phosphate transport system substrate-binding protein